MNPRPAELEGRLHLLALVFVARRFVGASLIPGGLILRGQIIHNRFYEL